MDRVSTGSRPGDSILASGCKKTLYKQPSVDSAITFIRITSAVAATAAAGGYNGILQAG
jgi:hypothetical protein